MIPEEYTLPMPGIEVSVLGMISNCRSMALSKVLSVSPNSVLYITIYTVLTVYKSFGIVTP